MLIDLILILPLTSILLSLLFRWSVVLGATLAFFNLALLIFGIVLAFNIETTGPVTAIYATFYADSLSSFMVIVIGLISFLSSLFSIRFSIKELAKNQSTLLEISRYTVLTQIFIFTMLFAVVSSSVAMIWVAVEATTIATTFLVGFRKNKKALEASWKYIIICSVGVGLAFVGTLFFYFASAHIGGPISSSRPVSLDWTFLIKNSKKLNPQIIKFGFGFILLGYGTKTGLAPMHSWLPDAHSQAPAPVSALMSGVLITVAFYTILRFKAITDIAVGRWFSQDLLIAVGLLSLLLATSLLITQKEIKRMLAYHSIEHMALIALGAAAGSEIAIAAVLLHILGHGLVKAILFIASGEMLITEGSTEIAKLKSLLTHKPLLGGIFGVGLLALLGLPPFSLFTSEFAMMKSEISVGLGWVVGISLVLMAVIFGVVVSHARHILVGESSGRQTLKTSKLSNPIRASRLTTTPLVLGLILSAAIGVVSWPLQTLLLSAAKVISG